MMFENLTHHEYDMDFDFLNSNSCMIQMDTCKNDQTCQNVIEPMR